MLCIVNSGSDNDNDGCPTPLLMMWQCVILNLIHLGNLDVLTVVAWSPCSHLGVLSHLATLDQNGKLD